VFIIEPVLLVFMVLGLVLPSLFSLINEEIGAHDRGPKGRLGTTLALIGVLACWGIRDYEHRRAIALLEARTYKGVDAIKVSAYPYMLNPFHWYAIAETSDFFATMEVDTLIPEVDPRGEMQIRYKPEETSVTLAAKKSYLGRVYLSWAQYPVTETEQIPADDGSANYAVRFRDLRYAYPGRDPRMLGATVYLKHDLQVVGEQFGVRSPKK
jgi:inner membrane protein